MNSLGEHITYFHALVLIVMAFTTMAASDESWLIPSQYEKTQRSAYREKCETLWKRLSKATNNPPSGPNGAKSARPSAAAFCIQAPAGVEFADRILPDFYDLSSWPNDLELLEIDLRRVIANRPMTPVRLGGFSSDMNVAQWEKTLFSRLVPAYSASSKTSYSMYPIPVKTDPEGHFFEW
jgi:hypothetical protein